MGNNGIVKSAYEDVVQPAAREIGQTIAIFPRWIRSLLLRPEVRIIGRENIRKVVESVNKKSEGIPQEELTALEPYIAVPAIQSMSYCMDSDELRDMYANLLASSMYKIKKSGVMPCFVEIIKQLCPDEARILKYIFNCGQQKPIPVISVKVTNEEMHASLPLVKKFSLVGEDAHCEVPDNTPAYLDNICRLGLIESPPLEYIADKSIYERLMMCEHVKKHQKIPSNYLERGFKKLSTEKSVYHLTSLGLKFCIACIMSQGAVSVTIKIHPIK